MEGGELRCDAQEPEKGQLNLVTFSLVVDNSHKEKLFEKVKMKPPKKLK